ncbi:MAG TPA: putative lipid II flippase FtsW [Patescibacteria group bacterium]|nr:putative lipid II flippase FtsW [Patescibacteria group bacterium]
MAAAKYSNQSFDYVLLGTTAFLLIFGIIILASVSAPYSQQKFGNTYYFLKHQIFFGLLPGLALGYLAFKIKLSTVKKWIPLLLLANLLLMVIVFIPGLGLKIEGATRWLKLGPFSFQPSEFLKITFILYLAAWLANRLPSQGKAASPAEKNFSRTFAVFLAIFALIASTLILQSDISTLGVIFFVSFLMYFSRNTPLWHSASIILLGMASFFFLVKLAPYRLNRILVFLNPEKYTMGIGYQLSQSRLTIGSGGIIGTGLGLSSQKFFTGYLPVSISDSIFVIFSQETGFVGSFLLIALFLIFLWRGFKITKEAKDKFSQTAALGIVSWIVIQTFINIGAMIGILPVTGIPLPFISYGGSALIATLIGTGLLLNISKNRYQ